MNTQNFTSYPLNLHAENLLAADSRRVELWEYVPGVDLQASTLGRVRYNDGELLAVRIAEDNHSYILTEIDCKSKLLSVAMMVLVAYRGRPPGYFGTAAEFIKASAGTTHEHAGKLLPVANRQSADRLVRKFYDWKLN